VLGAAVAVRPPVPGPDGEARRRLHRGALARDLDRPEVDQPEPALDGGHDYRGLRLPAGPVRAGGASPLPELRPPDRPAEPRADRRPDPRAPGGHEVPGPRTGRTGPQGGVRAAAGRPRPEG